MYWADWLLSILGSGCLCVCVCVSMCDAGGGGAQGTASFQGRDEEGLASAVVSRGQMMGLSEVFDRQNDWYLVKEKMSVTQSCLTLHRLNSRNARGL